jgi:ferric iron reductase protein FhuF
VTALDRAARRHPKLGLEHRTADPSWVLDERLLDPGSGVAVALLEAYTTARGAVGRADRAAAASLFFQQYSHRVTGPPVAAWALGGPVPRLDPARTWVRFADGAAAALALDRVDPFEGDAAALREVLRAEHLAPMIDIVVEASPVSRRILQGDADASVAGVFTMLAAGGEPADGCLAAAPEIVSGLAWVEAEGTEVVHRRRTCCLAYRLGSPLCRACSRR